MPKYFLRVFHVDFWSSTWKCDYPVAKNVILDGLVLRAPWTDLTFVKLFRKPMMSFLTSDIFWRGFFHVDIHPQVPLRQPKSWNLAYRRIVDMTIILAVQWSDCYSTGTVLIPKCFFTTLAKNHDASTCHDKNQSTLWDNQSSEIKIIHNSFIVISKHWISRRSGFITDKATQQQYYRPRVFHDHLFASLCSVRINISHNILIVPDITSQSEKLILLYLIPMLVLLPLWPRLICRKRPMQTFFYQRIMEDVIGLKFSWRFVCSSIRR